MCYVLKSLSLAPRCVVSSVHLRVFHLLWGKVEYFHEFFLLNDFVTLCLTGDSIQNSKYYFKMRFGIKY